MYTVIKKDKYYTLCDGRIEGISSNALLNRIDCTNKILVSKEELIPELENRILEVVLTMGAGDIDRLVDPIKDMLDSKIAKN